MKLRPSLPLRLLSILWSAALLSLPALAQSEPPTAPANGPRALDPGWHRLVGARIVTAPGSVLENATLALRDGRIVYVGATLDDQEQWEAVGQGGAREWDCRGLHVYPGLIDSQVTVSIPEAETIPRENHWNERVTPQRSALDAGGIDPDVAADMRAQGFTAAVISPDAGIFRGFGALVSLAEASEDESVAPPPVYREAVYQAVAFELYDGWGSERGVGYYPDSQMGAIAIVRQVLSDVAHRASLEERRPHALDSLLAEGTTYLFETENELEALRAAKIATEFERPAILRGSGFEFRRLGAIAADGLRVVLPLDYPELPDVSSIGAAEAVGLRALMNWEQAPSNPRRLDAAGVPVALTSVGLEDTETFFENLRGAIAHGLEPERALAMLTTHPAQWFAAPDSLGRLAPGHIANILVADGPLFEADTRVIEVWIDGLRHPVEAREQSDLAGSWTVRLTPPIPDEVRLEIQTGADGIDSITIQTRDASVEAESIQLRDERLSFVFDHTPFGMSGVFTVSGLASSDEIFGDGRRSDGTTFGWHARRAAQLEDDEQADMDGQQDSWSQRAADLPSELGLPFGPYADQGAEQRPSWIHVEGATLWTSGPEGVIENGSLVLEDGRIVHVGEGFGGQAPAGGLTIDASGKHVTPGLIDCHSHTGISRGVNEAGQAITAEVRIGDVTDPDAINWYRQLAGGLTTANCLHGSANPMGGQNQVVKLRWGVERPDQMHFEGAKPGIKFALGENVKQSNWGDRYTTRYPQSRMGVETLMRDRFNAARDYALARAADPPAPRDLELEALAEILAGERLVHCHSYRQDEILMLCRLAADYGFRIGTFQHVLEGYKVAEAIRERAIGASCFSDWWGYKIEVQDAIPYAGAIMHDAGVLVSFNSDSNEVARHMNLEAAKAVKYGSLAPAEALEFVTINPAKQLEIAERVGSLEVGKDADFVIWSGDPLSTFSKAESTWIEGRAYFSIERDAQLRRDNDHERQRILQKVLALGESESEPDAESESSGQGSGNGSRREARSDGWIERRRTYMQHIRDGQDVEEVSCGECGMQRFASDH